MNKFSFSLGVAVSLLLPAVQAATVEDLQVQLNAQQRTMLNQQNQLNQLQSEIASLRGAIEQLNYQLRQQNAVPTDAAPTTSAASTAGTQAAPAVTAVPAAQQNATAPAAPAASDQAADGLKPADAQAKALYDAAYAKVTANDFAAAAAAFNNYLTAYPDNSLTPNAWYWLGQVQYRQNNLDAARVSFLNVARFTSSAKRPDALYKLGLISKQKGDSEKAQRYFNLVISTYPADTSANMARRELGQQP